MTSPLISIIITVLNGSQTLLACLSSIQEQTFADFELIIVDGGSNDASVELIKLYRRPNLTVRVIPGMNLYAGLNLGIELAKGRWLYFMGADDQLYRPNTLAEVAKAIAQKKPNTQVLTGVVASQQRAHLFWPKTGTPQLMLYQVHHQGAFYKRELFAIDRFDESLRIAADYKFNLRLKLADVKHESINIVVCRFSENGISSREYKLGFREMQLVHKQLFNGVDRAWTIGYFWLRRQIGWRLRDYGLLKTFHLIKKIVG